MHTLSVGANFQWNELVGFSAAYVHGFSSVAFATQSHDVTFMSNDVGVGYRIYQAGGPALLSTVTPTVEAHVTTPAASSEHALLTQETTRLEPGAVDHKLYVAGIGTVVEHTVKGGNESFTLLHIYHHAMGGKAGIWQPYVGFDSKSDRIDDSKKRGWCLRDIEVLVNQWQRDHKDTMGNWIEL